MKPSAVRKITPPVPQPPKCPSWNAVAAAGASAASQSAASGGNTSSSAPTAPHSWKRWRDTWNVVAARVPEPSPTTHPSPLRLQLTGLGTATRNLLKIRDEGKKAGEEEAKERILSIL